MCCAWRWPEQSPSRKGCPDPTTPACVPKPRPQSSPSPRTQSHFPPNPKHTQEGPGCSTNCPTSARAAGGNPTRPGFIHAGGTGSAPSTSTCCCRGAEVWGASRLESPTGQEQTWGSQIWIIRVHSTDCGLSSGFKFQVLSHSPCGLKSLWSFPHERLAGCVTAVHKRERVYGTLRGTPEKVPTHP